MPQHRLTLLFAAALLSSVHGLGQTSTPPNTPGIAIANIDTSVKPGDDFYHFANGGYIKRTPLPTDRASIGVFNTLADRSFKQVAAIIDDATSSTSAAVPAPDAAANREQRKIADLYRSYMNEPAIEAHGLASLKARLAAIDAIKSPHDLAEALGASVRADVDALNNTNYHTANIFGLWVAPGSTTPTTTPPTSSRADSRFPTATTTSPNLRRWGRSGRSTRPTSPPC